MGLRFLKKQLAPDDIRKRTIGQWYGKIFGFGGMVHRWRYFRIVTVVTKKKGGE